MLLGQLCPGQLELACQLGSQVHHLDAGEVAEELIQQRQPQVARVLHQLAHRLAPIRWKYCMSDKTGPNARKHLHNESFNP